MKKPKPNKLSLSIIIFFLSFLLYVPSLWYSFVWDDTSIIHTQINTMKAHGILWGGGGLYYRPLVAMSFLVDNALWEGNPYGFHLTNMVINSLNCVLVFILGTFLFKRTLILNLNRGLLASFFAALIFLCHPAHADSVAWIAGRTDILASTCFLVSFLSYIIYRQTSDKKALIVTALSFVLALLSKEIAIALPLVFLMYDLFIFRKGAKTSLAILGGCAIVLVAYLTVRGGSDPTAVFSAMFAKMSSYTDKLSLIDYVGRICCGLGFYWNKTIAPVNLTIFPDICSGCNLFFLAVLIILIGICAAKKDRFLGFSIGFFLLTLLPCLPVLFFTTAQVAVRYLYLPVFGLSIGLAHIMITATDAPVSSTDESGRGRWPGLVSKKTGYLVIFMLMVVTFSGLSLYREFDWKENETLWKREIAENNSMFARAKYIGCLLGKKKIYEAEKETDHAMRMIKESGEEYPKIVISILYSHLGRIMARKGDLDKAEEAFLEAQKNGPRKSGNYHNLGFIYLKRFKKEPSKKEYLEKAKGYFRQSLKIAPGCQESTMVMGYISKVEGNIEEANRWYEKTIMLNPHTKTAQKARKKMNIEHRTSNVEWEKIRRLEGEKVRRWAGEKTVGANLCVRP